MPEIHETWLMSGNTCLLVKLCNSFDFLSLYLTSLIYSTFFSFINLRFYIDNERNQILMKPQFFLENNVKKMFNKVQFASFAGTHPHFFSLFMKMQHKYTAFGMRDNKISKYKNWISEFESFHLIITCKSSNLSK